MNAPSRVGWCPGALRPMASGDGLILRVKPRGGRLDLAQARRIAEVSRDFGNRALDLTSHANLQIRGVSQATLDPALAALDDVGLIDPSAGGEAVRNVVSSPLAGLDPRAVLDIRPLVAALERRLTEDETLHRLPAKFNFVVDDGGAPGLGDVLADIRFEALGHAGDAMFGVSLGGDDATKILCPASGLVETAIALTRVFIASSAVDPDIRRMRHLVEREGAASVLARARLGTLSSFPLWDRPDGGGSITARHAEDHSGYLRVAAPFGRLDADQLETIVVAAATGAGELRLTPWRAFLLPGLGDEASVDAARHCEASGLIVDPDDRRLSVAACPGAPGCHRGSTPVLADAARLAKRLRPSMARGGIALHVSGCGKGCAHAGQAPITLVAHDGLYDIVIDGGASDEPIVRNLTIEETEGCLKASSMREHWP